MHIILKSLSVFLFLVMFTFFLKAEDITLLKNKASEGDQESLVLLAKMAFNKNAEANTFLEKQGFKRVAKTTDKSSFNGYVDSNNKRFYGHVQKTDGKAFEGYFVNGLPSNGTLKYPKGLATFEGQFDGNGKPETGIFKILGYTIKFKANDPTKTIITTPDGSTISESSNPKEGSPDLFLKIILDSIIKQKGG